MDNENKTILTFKEEYAKEKGFSDWADLYKTITDRGEGLFHEVECWKRYADYLDERQKLSPVPKIPSTQILFVKRSVKKDGLPKKNGMYICLVGDEDEAVDCTCWTDVIFRNGSFSFNSTGESVLAWLEPKEAPTDERLYEMAEKHTDICLQPDEKYGVDTSREHIIAWMHIALKKLQDEFFLKK